MNLRARLMEGRLRPVTASSHAAVVTAELALEHAVDRLMSSSAGPDAPIRELTALVKTFERPQMLRRLVDSVKRSYPDLRVVVVDDSREPGPLQGVETITMPYDSGLSAGRNEGVRHASTKYVLVLDDDFIFYRHTQLGPALAAMEREPEIDIMGGQVVNLPFYRRLPRSLEGPLYATTATPRRPIGSSLAGFAVAAKVPNFFVARRDRLALVPWDRRFRRIGHADFFTRALGVLTTVYNPQLRCLHARTPFVEDYMAIRLDFAADFAYVAEKYGAE